MAQETISEPDAVATGEPLAADLRDCARQFEAIRRESRELLEGLSDAQFNWRAAPGRWSIAECIAHLNVAGQVYLPVIDRHIREARAAGRTSAGPFRYSLFGKLFVYGMEPPARFKFKTPKLYAPQPEHLLLSVGPAFETLQEQLIKRLYAANGLDLGGVKIASPGYEFFKISLGQIFQITAAHERRHLYQARQVKADPAFPRAGDHTPHKGRRKLAGGGVLGARRPRNKCS